jgi:hypothetical protein
MPPKDGGLGVGTVEKLAHEAGWTGTLAPRQPPQERFREAIAKLIAESRTTDAPQEPSDYPAPKSASELHKSAGPLPWFAIDGLILGGHVNPFSGDGGVGKSTFGRHVSVAVSAGKECFGKRTRQMPSLIVTVEDGPSVTVRSIEKICSALSVDVSSIQLDAWCLGGHDTTLAYVNDDGSWTYGPFYPVLDKRIASYGQPIFLVLDNVSDIAVLDETKRGAVNTLIKKVLGHFCEKYGTTIILITHPSKAAMADGTGYAGSTAWNNGVRQRLTLDWPSDAKTGNRRILKVAKSNYGEPSETELFLIDGVFLTRDAQAPAEQDARHMDACVAAAIAAAEQGYPIQTQRKPPKWVFDEIESASGRRPTRRELFETLNYAARAGRVRYLKGTSKRMAGFYPWDQERAAELAAEAKRHAGEVEALSTRANARESADG